MPDCTFNESKNGWIVPIPTPSVTFTVCNILILEIKSPLLAWIWRQQLPPCTCGWTALYSMRSMLHCIPSLTFAVCHASFCSTFSALWLGLLIHNSSNSSCCTNPSGSKNLLFVCAKTYWGHSSFDDESTAFVFIPLRSDFFSKWGSKRNTSSASVQLNLRELGKR